MDKKGKSDKYEVAEKKKADCADELIKAKEKAEESEKLLDQLILPPAFLANAKKVTDNKWSPF